MSNRIVICIPKLEAKYDKNFILFAPIFGYGFAWVGHFFFEKNKPATFKFPIYSFMGDWMMFKDILIRKEYIFNPKEG